MGWIVSNPSPIGSVAPGFALEREVEHDIMGLLRVSLTSQSLLVAGYLSLSLVLPAVVRNVRLESIRITLHQQFTLKSLRSFNQEELVKISVIPVWSTKRSQGPIGDLAVGQGYSLAQRIRINPDNAIRPSTAKWSKTGIRVSHMFELTVSYTSLGDYPYIKTEQWTVMSPATIASCCCLMAELQLPPYVEEACASPVMERTQIGFCTSCLVSLNGCRS